MRGNLLIIILLVAGMFMPSKTVFSQDLTDDVSRRISERFRTNQAHAASGTKLLHGSSILRRFYANRSYAPAWIGESGPFARGYVVPDSFTHVTSEQRKRSFYEGCKAGDLSGWDTSCEGQL